MPDTATAPRPVILTGLLHLGYYCGSLRNRVALQHGHQQFVLIADAQALTDNADNPGRITRHVLDLALDYLAVGIDPGLTTICVQSALPALCELTQLYLNLVTVARSNATQPSRRRSRHAASGATSRRPSCAIRWPRPPTSPRSGRHSCRWAPIRPR